MKSSKILHPTLAHYYYCEHQVFMEQQIPQILMNKDIYSGSMFALLGEHYYLKKMTTTNKQRTNIFRLTHR